MPLGSSQAKKDRTIDYYSDDDEPSGVREHEITQKPTHMGKYLVEYVGMEDNDNDPMAMSGNAHKAHHLEPHFMQSDLLSYQDGSSWSFSIQHIFMEVRKAMMSSTGKIAYIDEDNDDENQEFIWFIAEIVSFSFMEQDSGQCTCFIKSGSCKSGKTSYADRVEELSYTESQIQNNNNQKSKYTQIERPYVHVGFHT
ncbi:MAG: hypothetical protein Q9195_002511 [Heterodermia aff. obscurata]